MTEVLEEKKEHLKKLGALLVRKMSERDDFKSIEQFAPDILRMKSQTVYNFTSGSRAPPLSLFLKMIPLLDLKKEDFDTAEVDLSIVYKETALLSINLFFKGSYSLKEDIRVLPPSEQDLPLMVSKASQVLIFHIASRTNITDISTIIDLALEDYWKYLRQKNP